MNRRDAIARVGLLMGGTVIGAEIFLTGCARKTETVASGLSFNPDQIALLDEVGETILPETASSPGAKAAKIGEFMKVIVTDCYEEKDQKVFMAGIGKLDEASEAKFSKDFMSLSPAERTELLVALDGEAKSHESAKKPEDDSHYFTMMKQITLWGYFTSEVGSKNALRYNPVPGRYEGCIDYKKGDKAWSAI